MNEITLSEEHMSTIEAARAEALELALELLADVVAEAEGVITIAVTDGHKDRLPSLVSIRNNAKLVLGALTEAQGGGRRVG